MSNLGERYKIVSDVVRAPRPELDRATAWKITGVLLAGLVLLSVVPSSRIAFEVARGMFSWLPELMVAGVTAIGRALIDTVVVAGTLVGVVVTVDGRDRPGSIGVLTRYLCAFLAVDALSGYLMFSGTGGWGTWQVLGGLISAVLLGVVVAAVRAATGSRRWPVASLLCVLLGGLVLRFVIYVLGPALGYGYGYGDYGYTARASELAALLLAVIVVIIVHFASGSGTSRPQAPAQVGYTNDGQPIYPVVGYTSDGTPVTADRAQGVRAPSGQTNSLAIAALVTSFVFSPAGIIMGHIARGQIRRTGEGGDGMALAALVIGYLSVAISVAAIIALVAAAGHSGAF